MSAAAAAAALGSFAETVCGMAPVSDLVRSVVLAFVEEGDLPLACSGLAGAGDGRLGGAPLVAVSRREVVSKTFFCDCDRVPRLLSRCCGVPIDDARMVKNVCHVQ
jgi:hypothetical protein